MRIWIALVLSLCPAVLRAEEDLAVLKPGSSAIPPRKMLYTYLLGQAQKHFDARRQVIAALKAPADVQRRQVELRAEFIKALGGLPERTPLRPQVVGKLPGAGYTVERVIYESRPNHHVTAVLFLPEGKGPFPGVLLPCGHSGAGKADSSYQRAMILLAKNGIAALSYDPISQGERVQLLEQAGKRSIASMTNEHTMIGVGALLVGQSTASYRIWDGIRSLDYLASRPEIDPKRLGCTGCSGGGTLTCYLMALDDRILAAAPSCYVTSLEKLFATLGPQDAEQNIPGQVAFGLEHADYLNLRIPRPTLLLTATRDFFNIQGTWATFREAKQVYGIAGHAERVDLFEYNTGHGYPKPQREAMVRFMRRWLLQKDDAPTEGDFPIFKVPELQCTRTGQVLEDLKGKSAFDLTAEREKSLAMDRPKFMANRPKADGVNLVRKLMAVPDEVKPAKCSEIGKIERPGYTIRKLLFEPEAGIHLAALLFDDNGKKPGPLVIHVNGQGKAADAAVGGPIEKLVKAGNRVLALDLRGWGETAPGSPASDRPDYFGADWKESFLAMHINRPLLGQRVFDLLAVIESLSAEQDRTVHLVGVGSAGPVALHAAVLQPRIAQVTIERSLSSWSAVTRTPISHNQLTNVVPGILKHYDLPQLPALIAPRKVIIRAPVDPLGKPMAETAP